MGATAALLACLSGCAAPGPPLPPTLNLPQIVQGKGLTAVRVSDGVRLRWTTPEQTTDKLPVKGAMTAEICRGVAPGRALISGCVAVVRVGVVAGETEAEDKLPAELATGPVRLLEYRVRLLNAAGRTAGLSPAVYAAAGAGVAEVEGFAGAATGAGVELRWKKEAAGEVELERTLLDPAPEVKGERREGLPGAEKQTLEVRLRGDGTDAGGMVDRTVELGHSYRYVAQRVVGATVGGTSVELRSGESEALTFAVRDVFAPSVPAGLVAVPGFGDGGRAVIDLSWDAVVEQGEKTRVAGYVVYRRNAGSGDGEWRRISAGVVSAAAYRDADVVSGQRYAYRVTAVSTAGVESGPGGEVVEVGPRVQ